MFILGLFLGVVLLVRFIVSCAWSPLAARYPAVPPRPDAVRRSMQTIGLRGWCGFNHCMTIAADEDYLHLSVIPPIRWLCACAPVSIPWSEITGVSRGWLPGYWRATVAGVRLDAPRWCLELASTHQPDGEDDSDGSSPWRDPAPFEAAGADIAGNE